MNFALQLPVSGVLNLMSFLSRREPRAERFARLRATFRMLVFNKHRSGIPTRQQHHHHHHGQLAAWPVLSEVADGGVAGLVGSWHGQ